MHPLRITYKLPAYVIIFWLSALSMTLCAQESIPDFTRGDKIPDGYKHDWNLGPTGARGWIFTKGLETSLARQILITKVDRSSPSDGILKPGDVILGIGSDPFSFDPRVELGKAIGVAEAGNRKLKLSVWRSGKTKTLTLRLQKLGSYSDTAPFKCRKSKKIFEQGCEALARRMAQKPNRNKIIRALNTLALLSSGQRKYLPLIKQQVQWASKYSDTEGRELCSWYYGPINMLLAEYTLVTGDRTYVPAMKRISLEIAAGQSTVGSWGHRFAKDDGRLLGYGMMNAPGLPLTTSLVLARKAGVQDERVDYAIERSIRLLRFYVGKGCVPYGDHTPFMKVHDDNGKNGIAAIMFHQLEDKEAAEFFSRMGTAAHGLEREMGHTGNFLNLLWAMPSVAISGPNATGQWMKEYSWYFDLARKWDGTFQHQGPAQEKNDSFAGWDSTGAFLLAYGQSLRHLQITGAKSDLIEPLTEKEAASIVADGRGYSKLNPKGIYANDSAKQLLQKLGSWSPIVRQRSAEALARRKGDFSRPLAKLLRSKDKNEQLGACQAIAQLKGRAAATVPALRRVLKSDDLWVRISAAQALAGIGKQASVAVPQLLHLATVVDLENDPRSMQQRYLAGTLFDKRTGLLKHSLEHVDPEQFYTAVRAGLQNEDGHARGVVSTVYGRLSFEELKPLLPAIYAAMVEPAPSGNMFADNVRLAGLEVLAKHHIEEGMEQCIEMMGLGRWNVSRRVPKCMTLLRSYGTAARKLAPELRNVRKKIAGTGEPSDHAKKQIKAIDETLAVIEGNSKPPKLRSLANLNGK